jgi:hypothetical protein
MITQDMKSLIATQKLCFAATVTPDGKPNLSPKGTIRVLDDETIFFCDIGSPKTRDNLRSNPFIEINVVDIISRRGYRFFGKGEVLTQGDVYDKAVQILNIDGPFQYTIQSIIVVTVERAEPLVSPGYLFVQDEWEMREMYKKRRPELDAEFEENIKKVGAIKGEVE